MADYVPGTEEKDPKKVIMSLQQMARTLSETQSGLIEAGTLMLFQQTAAPTGWTKATTHNDKALRVVSGTAGNGGTSPFSTVFGLTATDATTLSTSQVPALNVAITTFKKNTGVDLAAANAADGAGFWAGGSDYQVQTTGNYATSGSGGSHTHAVELRVQYVDLIIASKD